MKRLIACISLVVAGAGMAPAATHHACRLAPADEYFGRLKLSILGIRNTIKDQGLKIDLDRRNANGTLGAMALTEDAIHDWQRKYPCDSWLPGTIFALEHVYAKIHTPYGRKRVRDANAWLRRDFPHYRIAERRR